MATNPIQNRQGPTARQPDRRWDRSTKTIVALAVLLCLALVLYQFRALLRPLLIAFLLAFILNPVIDFLERRVRISRGLATGLVFFVLCIALLGTLAAPVSAVPSVTRAIQSAQFDLKQLIDDISAFFDRQIEIAGYQFDLSLVAQELSTTLRGVVEGIAQGTLDVVFGIASGAFWVVFVIIVAFYFVRDAYRLAEAIDRMAPPGYRDDVLRLRREISQTWSAFLRGQLLLGSAMALATVVVDTAIGLPYAWALGLFAGVMELVPNIGPYIAAIPAVLVALIQGSGFIPLGNFWFAVLVAGLYFLLQLIENNFFVPRILGRTLKMHPLVVIIGLIAGGRLAGILGVLLAAPILATFRIIGRYLVRRLYDRDPFVEPAEESIEEDDARERRGLKATIEGPRTVVRKVEEATLEHLHKLEHLQQKVREAAKQYTESSDSSSEGDQ
ncbi:MAG: AI-2E family transporter [Anaerolineae bacterium]|jgi:predicted PurR-regulated permease PerM